MTMRLLRLDLGGQSGSVNLHPFLTVMQRKGVDDRQPVIKAARSLANGDGSGVHGLVETEKGLIELVGSPPDDLRCPLTTEDIVIDTDEAAAGSAPSHALQAEFDQLQRRASIDAVAVEMIRADLDPGAAARLQHLRSYKAGDSEALMDPQIVANLAQVAQSLAAVSEQPPTLIESAPGMKELIGEWRAYVAKRDSNAEHIETLEQRITDATTEVKAAEIALMSAEADCKPVVLSAAEEARLDELANPTSGKRGKKKPRERNEEEEAEMKKILARVGLPSFTAYAMHRLNPQPPPDKQAALHTFTAAVARAQADLEEAKGAVSLDPVSRELEYDRAAIVEQAAGFLGAVLPEDLGPMLESQINERENPLWLEGLRKLYDTLLDVGSGIPENMAPEDLPQWAEEWIELTEASAREAAGIAPDDIDDQLEAAEEALGRHARAMGRIDQMEAAAELTARKAQQIELQIARAEQPT
ncbi:MAG: hypothetical protein KJN63_04645, partial [Acidimicrobiia bacterium]|nr:hypothetical protein [Acidimicrobiia bacterium]